MKAWILILTGFFFVCGQAQEDASSHSMPRLNLSPDSQEAEGEAVSLKLDVQRLKIKGAHAEVILRQMTKRVRVEFEGTGIPPGHYALAVANVGPCPSGHPLVKAGKYKTGWNQVHRFLVNTTHIATEKSVPKASLRTGEGQKLAGHALGFFKVQGQDVELLDCQVIQ